MAIQIDRLETNVEITPPTSTSRPATDAPRVNADDPATASVLRDAVAQIMAEELSHFRRMRGH